MTFSNKINALSRKIVRNYDPEKIILFGSCAAGKVSFDSDIDLLIIKETDDPVDDRLEKVDKFISHRVAVDVLVFTPYEIKERLKVKDFFICDILKHGKELYSRKRMVKKS